MSPSGNDASDTPAKQPPVQANIMLSDVIGRDRSTTLFAEFARDVAAISTRLDSSSHNSTVLAPLNSAVEALPRKPWEDSAEYGALGAGAYEGDEGKGRAARNMRRFVEAHVLPTSPWAEGVRSTSLLSVGDAAGGDGDREVWWEMKDGKRVVSFYPEFACIS